MESLILPKGKWVKGLLTSCVSLIGGSLLESQRLTTKDHSAGVLHSQVGLAGVKGQQVGGEQEVVRGQGLSKCGSDFGPLLSFHICHEQQMGRRKKKRKVSSKFFTYFCSISCGSEPSFLGRAGET